jgi:hypothetical protein
MTEKLNFGAGAWASTQGEYGFWCAGDPGWLPATDLFRKTVNLGTKDGLVYDSVIIGGVFPDGTLAFRPGVGRVGWPHQPGREPRTVEPGECVPVTEIARGYVHEGGTP